MLFKILICFLAGMGAGLGTGFAGMSAAGIISPLLLTFCSVSPYEAIGIGLASDVLASAASAWTYKKHGNLDVKNAMPLLLTVLIMTIVGSYIASFLPEQSMGFMSQIGLLVLGIKFILKPGRKTAEPKEESGKSKLAKAIIGGLFVGFICGFVGAGGGMMLLFVLTSFLGYEIHMAVGTSVFIMSFTALIGGISHFTISGKPDMLCLALCVLFTLIWARIASVIANKASEKVLCRVAGAVMLATSSVVLYMNYAK
ncbi:MAG: sulfite exporter TauE/SafE family protein [Oscillospiraceae bacterium]|nr:sulfite exporter TauE/SafE family protein [Oscillospiraceae bacterium]